MGMWEITLTNYPPTASQSVAKQVTVKRQRAGAGGSGGVGGLTQPLQPPKVSQSTNAAALPKGGEEIEREAVLGRRRCV